MSAGSALGWLVLAGFRGRARLLLRRLRTPRGLLGALAAGAWLAYLVASNAAGVRRISQGQPLELSWLAEVVAIFSFALGGVFSWLVVREGAGLGFTEAEAHVLFAAPLRRRDLVTYKLAQAGLGTLLGVTVLAMALGRGGLAERLMSAGAGWIALFTAALHGIGASLTRASLAQHGVSALRRRLLSLSVVGAIPVLAAVGGWRAPPLERFAPGPAGVSAWTRAVAETAPLSWALWPLRTSLDAVFAPSSAAFWAAVPGALLVLGVHLVWVYSSDAAFEEAALESARALSARVAALQSGTLVVGRGARGHRSRTLGGQGRPEAALAWKAFVRARRVVSLPVVVALAVLAGSLTVAVLAAGRGGAGGLAAFFAVVFHAFAALLGPLVFAGDLRRDVAHLDLLRSLPLRGRQILAAEIAVPFAQTVLAQWSLVVVFLALAGPPFPAGATDRLAIAAAMAIGGPAISALGFLVVNGLTVVYPESARPVAAGSSPLDHLGTRALVGAATFALLALALTPALLVGGGVGFVTWDALALWALPAAALAGAAVVAGEALLALRVLGRAFERIDLSE